MSSSYTATVAVFYTLTKNGGDSSVHNGPLSTSQDFTKIKKNVYFFSLIKFSNNMLCFVEKK